MRAATSRTISTTTTTQTTGKPPGSGGVVGPAAGAAVSGALPLARTVVKSKLPETGCPSAETMRHVTLYRPSGPRRAGTVTLRSDTAAQPVSPSAPPIWVRAETGPVLLPGEHAPWRAAPVAPPAAEEHPDGRSLFFAAPVPATGAVNAAPQADPAARDDADAGDASGWNADGVLAAAEIADVDGVLAAAIAREYMPFVRDAYARAWRAAVELDLAARDDDAA